MKESQPGSRDPQEKIRALEGELRRTRERLVIAEAKLEVLEQKHHIDPLTGLPNRLALVEKLPKLITQIQSNHESAPRAVMVIALDLNDFKFLNDTHGHSKGDEALIIFSDRLQHAVKEWGGDLVFRSMSEKGDEFTIVLPLKKDLTDQELEEILLRIKTDIHKDLYIETEIGNIPFSASMGYSILRADDLKTSEELLHEADVAMYQDKPGAKIPDKSQLELDI